LSYDPTRRTITTSYDGAVPPILRVLKRASNFNGHGTEWRRPQSHHIFIYSMTLDERLKLRDPAVDAMVEIFDPGVLVERVLSALGRHRSARANTLIHRAVSYYDDVDDLGPIHSLPDRLAASKRSTHAGSENTGSPSERERTCSTSTTSRAPSQQRRDSFNTGVGPAAPPNAPARRCAVGLLPDSRTCSVRRRASSSSRESHCCVDASAGFSPQFHPEHPGKSPRQ
jgi:hypothetical protein